MATATITRREDNRRWLRYESTSGFEVPAFGIVRVTSANLYNDGLVGYIGQRPTGTGVYAANSASPVAAQSQNNYGKLTFDWPAMVRLADDAPTPAAGDNWGVAANTWEVDNEDADGYALLGWRLLGLTVDRDNVRRTLVTPERPQIIRATVSGADIQPGGSGVVVLRNYGARELVAYLDWMHGQQLVSNGKSVLLAWDAEQDRYGIIGADCEDST